jgi:hypothetical protein
VIVIAVLVLLGVGGWLTYFYWPEPDLRAPVFNWYTTDDGVTWFQDDAERVPPFDHGGKPAARLHLYSCDGGRTTFVAYLQKLPEEVLAKYRAKGVDPQSVDDDDLAAEAGWLAKRPGDRAWVNSQTDAAGYAAIIKVKCPEGKGGPPVEIFPKNPRRETK